VSGRIPAKPETDALRGISGWFLSPGSASGKRRQSGISTLCLSPGQVNLPGPSSAVL
jgi:hypothetical protein